MSHINNTTIREGVIIMAAKLYELNTEILGKLVESPEASQNFIESILSDLPEHVDVETLSDVVVGDLSSSMVAGKSAEGFPQINGIVFQFKLNGKPAEMVLVMESVSYIKWWHDKSFFTLNYYNEHIKCLKGLSVKSKVRRRIVLSFLLDKDINLDKFHTVNTFLTDDGNGNQGKDSTFQVHDINFLCIPDEDTKLAHWCRLLIATDMNEIARIAQNHQIG